MINLFYFCKEIKEKERAIQNIYRISTSQLIVGQRYFIQMALFLDRKLKYNWKWKYLYLKKVSLPSKKACDLQEARLRDSSNSSIPTL